MTTQIARRLVVLATLLTIVAGQRCKVPVPFNSRLVGKRFFMTDDCYRPSASSEVRVNAKSFLFKPTYVTRVFIPTCVEKYVFHLRRDGKDPFVVYFPPLDFPGGFGGTTEELTKFCEKEHPKVREKYFPIGKTRKRFKESVRTIVKGTTEIRDFGCTETDEGFITQVQGRAFTNVDLDGIVTYLLGVAYQYNFCAESA